MSQAANDGQGRAWFLVTVLCAAAVFALWFLAQRDRVPPIEQSALGLDGLGIWLNADGMDARRFHGRGPLSGEGVGLRVLPLYDHDLDRGSVTFGGGENTYLNATPRGISRHVVTTKIETLPTFIILPKWRDGVRMLGAVHPEFLIPVTGSAGPAERITTGANADLAIDREVDRADDDEGGRVDEHDPRPTYVDPSIIRGEVLNWVDVPLGDFLPQSARLYAPQFMALPDNCVPLVGDPDRALLAECSLGEATYHVLSDPDLINNHGLAQGDNAAIARALITRLAGDGDVLIDYSTAVYLTARPDEHQRSWADMARMFEPPFTWLWLAGAGLLALLLWRAGIRGRPLLSIYGQGHGAARAVALQAQARLMRNAHADGALLRTLVAGRRQALADAWLGRERRAGHAFRRVVARLRLKDEALAAHLTDIFNRADALPDRIRPEVAADALADVERAYQKALELA